MNILKKYLKEVNKSTDEMMYKFMKIVPPFEHRRSG